MPANPPWQQSLWEEHFEEIQSLWELRSQVVRGAAFDEMSVIELDDRIEAHIDALVLAGDKAWPLLESGLTGGHLSAFASAIVLLRSDDARGADKVLAALGQAEGPARDGLREALCHSATDQVDSQLKAWYETGPPQLAVVVAEVFAYHQRFSSKASRLPEFLRDPDPAVRRAAWRIVALVDG